jgi:hypothetical protein
MFAIVSVIQKINSERRSLTSKMCPDTVGVSKKSEGRKMVGAKFQNSTELGKEGERRNGGDFSSSFFFN